MQEKTVTTLLPCPFCGAGETRIDENRGHSIFMSGKQSPLISAEVRHHCKPVEGQPQRRMITMTGRDVESAREAWNARI